MCDIVFDKAKSRGRTVNRASNYVDDYPTGSKFTKNNLRWNLKIIETQNCSVKKVFLKFLQNSLESTSAGVSFLIKTSDEKLEACISIEIHSSTGFSCEL